MKIVTVIGARPQFIKAAPFSNEIARRDNVEEVIIHTGQHYDANMSDVFFEEMTIPKPKYFLNLGGGTHGAMTGRMIEKIEEVLLKENPDWLVVYGDTNSTLAGALAAKKIHLKVAHIEAGLRSFNMRMPEEVNRILTDRISNLLFCTSQAGLDNLTAEGITSWKDANAHNVGDIMKDSVEHFKPIAKAHPITEKYKNYLLVTVHRAENTDAPERLSGIFEALNELSKDKKVVLPLHPRTKNALAKSNIDTSNIQFIEPVGYLEMINLIGNADMVLTDSGGLQKEAFYMKKPCITMRDETEWIELFDQNFNVLVGANKDNILKNYNNFDFNTDYDVNIYGDGNASKKILDEMIANS